MDPQFQLNTVSNQDPFSGGPSLKRIALNRHRPMGREKVKLRTGNLGDVYEERACGAAVKKLPALASRA
ncbi:unnamed protein product [Fusarium graminearum]|uniref:Uncharacterized protein n=1 Tax=Gibberella zeae TaxID=5518 RepID=A0A4E9DWJ3_GIBZA|nr:unnamed protein product [Fusarium graminearum]CAF3556395.1 unnamed protein product [Fusarium graminearum]CAG1967038.1 unnamed protein product [Fusarium graminearum]CAG2017205.1 unnamed protein product [Fusarium graminearum]